MKCLIVEDDFVDRKHIHTHLSDYGDCFGVVNGCEAVLAVQYALDEGEPYDLMCLDIMMPKMNGQEALKEIRRIESERNIHGADGAKIIMTTGVDDSANIMGAFKSGCEAYIVKPVTKERLAKELQKLGLIPVGVGWD